VPANPTGLIYGTITVAALLAAESARQETYPRTVGAVVVTLLLYWLAYSYAQFTGERLAENEPFSLGRLGRSALHELAVLLGAVIPLAVLLIFWAFGASLADAVTAGIWTSAAMIVLCELVIGIRADLNGRELVRQSLFGALLGLLVIAMRVLLH
jgi:hypothetical protein